MRGVREEVWDQDLPPIRVNRDTVRKQGVRYRIGSVRLALGRIKTREEFEEEKREILAKQLSRYPPVIEDTRG
jgi:hypothetical protein